jgi:hypothetical protein
MARDAAHPVSQDYRVERSASIGIIANVAARTASAGP